jgi:hypothetical protein
MRMPAYLAALFLSLFLTACGGGGDSVVGESEETANASDDSTTTDDTASGGGTDGGTPVAVTVDSPAIGSGVGDGFLDGVLDIEVSNLSAGGSTLITANIVDLDNSNEQVVSQQYTVTFSSSCASDGRAEFSKENVTTSSGKISVTYKATGCSGSDLISFVLYSSEDTTSSVAVASGAVTVAPAEVGSLLFVDASAPAISIATIGDNILPKSTTLTFRIVDTSNNPIANKAMSFRLTNETGGVNLALTESVTNESGEAEAVVNAGTAHGVTYVVASTLAADGITSISTTSLPVSITTGLPDQDSFDISVDIFNPAAYDYNGEVVNITAYAADQFNNPVPDGTVVNFATESGYIIGYCGTVAGTCSVPWVSSGDRPGSHDAALGRVNEIDAQTSNTVLGMTTIVAYTLGESGYTDSNANGVYDVGEPFVSYPEVFQDDNNSGGLDVGEEFFDFDADLSYTAAPSFYQGTLCSDDAKAAGHCASFVHVRDSIRIIQSSHFDVEISYYNETFLNSGVYTPIIGDPVLGSPGGKFFFVLQDANGNMPANGTSVSVTGDGYDVYSFSGDIPTSIGELDLTGASGLPSYGVLIPVSYVEGDTPKSITITTELNGSTIGYTLF